MTPDTSRSEQVVEAFKKRKLARSALCRIQDLIHGFEQDRVADRRLARIGLVIIFGLIALAAYLFLRSESVTVSLAGWPVRI